MKTINVPTLNYNLNSEYNQKIPKSQQFVGLQWLVQLYRIYCKFKIQIDNKEKLLCYMYYTDFNNRKDRGVSCQFKIATKRSTSRYLTKSIG